MPFVVNHRNALIRFGKMLGFSAAILLATKLTLMFGSIANASTSAFTFLVIVLLSAFFGDLLVAIVTSLVATLCFDYFYLPPVGTFTITAFPDWISLATFLLASVITSHLTALAAENRRKSNGLSGTLVKLEEFGKWLLAQTQEQLTLSTIAQKTLTMFSLEYCSIHVYGEGKWQHFSGTAAAKIPEEIENRLRILQDHSRNLSELADEDMLGVRYVQIIKGSSTLAILAVKSETLPAEAMGTIAYMIGVQLNVIMAGKD
jgi:two-component system, OmpR family, sensor histidine kinase KdpD